MTRREENPEKCYQALTYAGAWKIWPNPVWYPPEGIGSIPFEMETGSGFHAPIKKLKGLALSLDGRLYGERSMSSPRESGYQMEGRVSIGGKNVSAFTSSQLFELPDGKLVDVAVFVCRGVPPMSCIPPFSSWHMVTPDELAAEMDDAAATGNADRLYKRARELEGYPHADLTGPALRHRSAAIEARLKGNIDAAARYEQLSEEYLDKFRKESRSTNPTTLPINKLKSKLLR